MEQRTFINFSIFRDVAENCTNRQAQHVISTGLFRFVMSERTGETESTYEDQESAIQVSMISLASNAVMGLGANSRFTHDFLQKHQTATLNHFRRIADYLELSSDTWYRVDGVGVTFLDGDDELSSRPEGPAKCYLRLVSISFHVSGKQSILGLGDIRFCIIFHVYKFTKSSLKNCSLH